jgi:hypothetical protein
VLQGSVCLTAVIPVPDGDLTDAFNNVGTWWSRSHLLLSAHKRYLGKFSHLSRSFLPHTPQSQESCQVWGSLDLSEFAPRDRGYAEPQEVHYPVTDASGLVRLPSSVSAYTPSNLGTKTTLALRMEPLSFSPGLVLAPGSRASLGSSGVSPRSIAKAFPPGARLAF